MVRSWQGKGDQHKYRRQKERDTEGQSENNVHTLHTHKKVISITTDNGT